MAATSFTPISLYYSSTATNVPTSGNLVAGELAINTADGKLFYKDSSGVVQVLATKATTAGTFTTVTTSTLTSPSATALTIQSAGTTAITVDTSQNVGIGTTSPTAKLNVTGHLSNIGAIFDKGATTQYGINYKNSAQTYTQYIDINNNGTNYWTLYDTTNAQIITQYVPGASGSNAFYTAGSERMRIDSSGNVGIGTSSPVYPLQVSKGTTGQVSFAVNPTGLTNFVVVPSNSSSTGTQIGTTGGDTLAFITANTERMRIDSSGNLLVGTSTGTTNGGYYFAVGSSSSFDTGHATGVASGTTFQRYTYAGSVIGSISQSGTTAVLYNTTSDYRLKTEVTPIKNALATVEALNPVSFTWIDGRPDDGFLAHELQAVIPNCVTGDKDAVNEDGTFKYQQMDNSGVIPFLVKAIQELKAEIDLLKGAK